MSGKTFVMTFMLNETRYFLTKNSWLFFTDDIQEATCFTEKRSKELEKIFSSGDLVNFILTNGLNLRTKHGKYVKYAITLPEFSNFIVRKFTFTLI